LRSLRGMEIRPTADRLRETLFDVLCAGDPQALAGTTWVDLYAGTGAVGIEALSRGASMVYFVETSRAAAELIAANLSSLGITGGFGIEKAEVARVLRRLGSGNTVADFVFLDPPYSVEEEYAKTLAILGESGLLNKRSVVIAEHQKKFDPGDTFGELGRYRKLLQGDAALSFYRRATYSPPDGGARADSSTSE